MSHDGSWRAACRTTIHLLRFQSEVPSVARGVTDPGVGSGALLGILIVDDGHILHQVQNAGRTCPIDVALLKAIDYYGRNIAAFAKNWSTRVPAFHSRILELDNLFHSRNPLSLLNLKLWDVIAFGNNARVRAERWLITNRNQFFQ
jgi:hypothetical protein